MIQSRRRSRFLLRPFAYLRVLLQVRGQPLERDSLVGLEVFGSKHRTVPVPSQLREDTVMGDGFGDHRLRFFVRDRSMVGCAAQQVNGSANHEQAHDSAFDPRYAGAVVNGGGVAAV